MQFLSILGFLTVTSMAAQVTIHNKCSTPVWLKPDSAGATGTVSFPNLSSLIRNKKIRIHTPYIKSNHPSPKTPFPSTQPSPKKPTKN